MTMTNKDRFKPKQDPNIFISEMGHTVKCTNAKKHGQVCIDTQDKGHITLTQEDIREVSGRMK